MKSKSDRNKVEKPAEKKQERKPQAKSSKVAVEEIVVSQPVVRRNVDRVKEVLVDRHPESSEQIMNGDAMFICNKYLQNEAGRSGVARLLGMEPSKCSLCSRTPKEEQCGYFHIPLNNCRNGILEWLEQEIVTNE